MPPRWIGRHDEDGQVAVLVAVVLVVLLGCAALVVDVGLAWAARTRAQTAADAAALAGAAELGKPVGDPLAVAKTYLDANVAGLAGSPGDPGWATNGDDTDGELTCFTPPASPVLGVGCPTDAAAIQVITPPIRQAYAFAGVFGGARSTDVKALAVASGTPAVACGLCVLDPVAHPALSGSGSANVTVTNGSVVVNSTGTPAARLTGGGSIIAAQIGGPGAASFQTSSSGSFQPPPVVMPPTPDPLAGVPACPDAGSPTPCPAIGPPVAHDGPGIIGPGVYSRLTVNDGVLTLSQGTYVITDQIQLNGTAMLEGHGVTLHFACAAYPTPCPPGTNGAQLQMSNSATLSLSPPTAGPFRGLAVFADRNNTATLALTGKTGDQFSGTVYAKTGTLSLTGTAGTYKLDSLIVAGNVKLTGGAQITMDFTAAVNALNNIVQLTR